MLGAGCRQTILQGGHQSGGPRVTGVPGGLAGQVPPGSRPLRVDQGGGAAEADREHVVVFGWRQVSGVVLEPRAVEADPGEDSLPGGQRRGGGDPRCQSEFNMGARLEWALESDSIRVLARIILVGSGFGVADVA